MSPEQQTALIRDYVGDRTNRRHKPGRGMERTDYRFDILCDYGIFRDLQRHRMLTIDWQQLSPTHGYVTPESIDDIGAVAAVGGSDATDGGALRHRRRGPGWSSRPVRSAVCLPGPLLDPAERP